MWVAVEISLTDEESQQLLGTLGGNSEDLAEVVAPFATAATEEIVRMILGQKVFTRGSDVREYRLLLLIKHAFNGRIPDEQTVSDLFQTTVTQSRSLIRSVMSKFQYDLSEAIEETIREVISSASSAESESEYSIILKSESLVEAINLRLTTIDGSLPQLSKKRGTVATYTLKPSSLNRLCADLGLESPVEDV